jgi:hypothetical protein
MPQGDQTYKTQFVYTAGSTTSTPGGSWSSDQWSYTPDPNDNSFKWVDPSSKQSSGNNHWESKDMGYASFVVDGPNTAKKFLARIYDEDGWTRLIERKGAASAITITFISTKLSVQQVPEKWTTRDTDTWVESESYTSFKYTYSVPFREVFFIPISLIVDPFALNGSDQELMEEIITAIRQKWQIA